MLVFFLFDLMAFPYPMFTKVRDEEKALFLED